MRPNDSKRRSARGFTVTELLIAISCAVILGVVGFAMLRMGTVLFAKITSNNLAHDESRAAVSRLVSDVHKAVSSPQLWDASATATGGLVTIANGTTTASCVSFQILPPDGGPYEVKNDPGNPNMIQIQYMTNGFDPQPGMRLIIPMYAIENDIIKVTSNGPHRNVWMRNEEERIPKSKDGTKVICYFTVRNYYVVEDGELRAYLSGVDPAGGATYNTTITPAVVGGKLVFRNEDGSTARPVTIARFVTSPKPFTLPNFPDRRYVGVNLTTEDSHYSNRGFKATNTLVAGSIPYRARICNAY
jgi:hypothetical protein